MSGAAGNSAAAGRGWSRLDGLAVALPAENVDTDQLIPARFMSAPRSAGYGGFLLHDLRRGPDGTPDPAFPLNRPEAAGARVLIARRNFGAGSSREAAVYALVDAGFRAVLAPSFGDIFAGNAVNNGLLPARLDPAVIEALLAEAPMPVSIDLEAGTIVAGARRLPLEIDPVWRIKLMRGWDDIDLTAAHADRIARHAEALQARAPWVWPTDRQGAGRDGRA